jgi:hypothetical protein
MEAGLRSAIEGPIADREPCAYLELEDTIVTTLTLEVHGRDEIGCPRQALEVGNRSSRVLLLRGFL